MTSKNESTNFFPFLYQHNRRNAFPWLFCFSVIQAKTEVLTTEKQMCWGHTQSDWLEVILAITTNCIIRIQIKTVFVALSNTDVKATMVFMKCFHQHRKRWLEMDLKLPKVKLILISSLSSDEISSSYSTKDQIRIRLRFLRGPHSIFFLVKDRPG